MERKVNKPQAETLIKQLNTKNNFRYERKYLASNLSVHQVVAILKSHPSFFREIFHKRRVNNIYFDTPEMEYHYSNKDGIMNRKKIRIRWYGETFNRNNDSKLEIKFRNNMIGDKWQFPLKPFSLNNSSSFSDIKKVFKGSNLPEDVNDLLAGLRPTLLNSYVRRYYQSPNKDFRVTIDSQLSYKKLNQSLRIFNSRMFENKFNTIIELKYDPEKDLQAKMISDNFPFRLSKSSKYCDGIDMAS